MENKKNMSSTLMHVLWEKAQHDERTLVAVKCGWRDYPAQWARLNWTDLLEDYPLYTHLFEIFCISDCSLYTLATDVELTFGHIFDARLVFYRDGIWLEKGTQSSIEHDVNLDGMMGTMARYGSDYSQCLVAISSTNADINVVDKGSALKLYGHYCEQRLLVGQRMYSPYEMRDTAYADALRVIKDGRIKAVKGAASFAADNLIAWINAVWLCWIFNLDVRPVIVGMVLDDITNPHTASNFATAVLPAWKDILTDRLVAEKVFRGSGGPGFNDCFEDGDVLRLCQQIDRATAALLRSLT